MLRSENKKLLVTFSLHSFYLLSINNQLFFLVPSSTHTIELSLNFRVYFKVSYLCVKCPITQIKIYLFSFFEALDSLILR